MPVRFCSSDAHVDSSIASTIATPSITVVLFQLADADVAKCERPLVIALQRDVALLRAAVVRVVDELARLDLGFPVRAPQLVLEQLEVVQPVLDVRAAREDARLVPVA